MTRRIVIDELETDWYITWFQDGVLTASLTQKKNAFSCLNTALAHLRNAERLFGAPENRPKIWDGEQPWEI